jgi:tetratricopeptide (TPR) repeat protein
MASIGKVTRHRQGSLWLSVTLAFALSISMTGCAGRTEKAFLILDGSLAWSRRDWPQSVSAFLRAGGASIVPGVTIAPSATVAPGTDSASASGADAFAAQTRDYALYGLASAYLSQNEYGPAFACLSSISEDSASPIRSGVWYQAGLIAYRTGEYAEAALYFRRSLENDPSALDAKLNLELSQRALTEQEASRSRGASGLSERAGEDDDADVLFTLIRKKEQDRWKNQEKASTGLEIDDY